jgi:hypothetical protein
VRVVLQARQCPLVHASSLRSTVVQLSVDNLTYRSSQTWHLVVGTTRARDENDRKRSIEGQITFVFTSFSRKRNRYDIVGNEYGADISVISKTIVVDRKYIDNDRNP